MHGSDEKVARKKFYAFFQRGKYEAMCGELSSKLEELQELKTARRAAEENAGAILYDLENVISRVRSEADELTDEFNTKISDFYAQANPSVLANWNHQAWQNWQPAPLSLPTNIRIGEIREYGEFGKTPLCVPASINLIEGPSVCIVRSQKDKLEQTQRVIHTLILRIAATMPFHSHFTLLDPSGLGRAFPMRRQLSSVRKNTEDTWDSVREVLRDIQRINETVLDMHAERFDSLPEEVRSTERLEFVVAANFPVGYDRRSIDGLKTIAQAGPGTGKYLILQLNVDEELPRGFSLDDFGDNRNVPVVDQALNDTTKLVIDAPPNAEFVSKITKVLSELKPPEKVVAWDDIAQLPQNQWWQGSADHAIQAPIGRTGSQQVLNLWFGVNEHGRPCAHGMVGAMTGSGKSNLFHSLILSLAVRYSPKELQFFLIDGKDGVEFAPYKNLPHAEVVSLQSSPELSRSVLKALIEEKERRNALFSSCGVRDLTSYRAAGSPEGNLPRQLLLIDEYQELFEGDSDNNASNWLLQLSQQGRSAGIHLLLASQGFGAPGLLNQSAIFGNIHLRLAMQMPQSAVDALAEFGRTGKALISACNMPGKIVLNDNSGDDNSNQVGKVAFISTESRDRIIAELGKRAASDDSITKRELNTIVLHGKHQPALEESSPLCTLSSEPDWPLPDRLAELASIDGLDGGFGLPGWIVEDNPIPVVLGQEFNVRGQLIVPLSQRPSQNLLLISGPAKVRIGMLISSLVSAFLTLPPTSLRISILDCSPAQSSQRNIFGRMTDIAAEIGYEIELVTEKHEIAAWTRRASVELGAEATAKRHLIIITDPDRLEDFRGPSSVLDTPSETNMALSKIVTEGPDKGWHTLVSSSGLNPLGLVFDLRKDLTRFGHKVVMQVSEDDSYALTRQRVASRLQANGPLPIAAFYMDGDAAYNVTFKPFEIDSVTQLEDVTQPLLSGVITRLKAAE